MPEYNFELFADYFQFYLQDEGQEDLSLDWTEEETKDRVALAPNTIGVGTARNTTVPVTIEVRAAPPNEVLEQWDKVYECSIDVPSGKLVVAGCTDYLPDAARIEVAPGPYRARVYHGDLETLSEDGLEGEDYYKVILWPGKMAEPIVIR